MGDDFNVGQLASLWNWEANTVAIGIGEKKKVIGSDPRRWFLYMTCSAALVAGATFSPFMLTLPVKFPLATAPPLKFSQKDDGLLATCEWFMDNTGGGAFNIFTLALRWLG